LKIVRIRCLSRIRFKISPKFAEEGETTSDLNSSDLLYCFFFSSTL